MLSNMLGQWKPLAIALVLPYLQLIGCSVIGLTIGASIDASQTDDRSFSGGMIGSAEPGSTIELTKRDSTVVEGVYGGIRKHPIERYRQLYDRTVLDLDEGTLVPRLDETVVVWISSYSVEGVFEGMDNYLLLIDVGQESDTTMVHLDRVTAIETTSGEISGGDLRRLVYGGNIPSMSYVVLSVDHEVLSIPVEVVESAEVSSTGNAALTGFLAGLAVDAIVVVVASQKASSCKFSTSGK